MDFYFKDAENNDEKMKTHVDTKEVSFYKNITNEIGLPFQVDMVVCNPPWIPASFVKETSPLDNGVYDPEEKFLKSAFNFCRIHLKKDGEMLLIYSDLAY